MAKVNKTAKEVSSALSSIVGVVAWLTGLLVALAVGFGMIAKTLVIPKLPEVITVSAGWIVVVLALLGAILAIFERLGR